MIDPATLTGGITAARGVFTVLQRIFGTVTSAFSEAISGGMSPEEFERQMGELRAKLSQVNMTLDALEATIKAREERVDSKFDQALGRNQPPEPVPE